MDSTVFFSMTSFILILAILIFLRARNSRFEIKPADIVVAVLPVIVFLLATGKLQKFEIGEGGVKIETAFIQAQNATIVSQVTEVSGLVELSDLPSEAVELNLKGGVDQIPNLIARKTEGLQFRLGYGRYYGPAIDEYLSRLSRHSFFKYLVIENSDGTFFGIIDARMVSEILLSGHQNFTTNRFADWLNNSNVDEISSLPGFISADNAVSKDKTDKGQALKEMEDLNIEILPVVDNEGKFEGVISRSRLTASLLIDIARNLEN
jgi:hypothetical protein